MLVIILQSLFKFLLIISAIFGFAFMVACTAFVIICLVHGDIKISITRSKAENEKKWLWNVEIVTIGGISLWMLPDKLNKTKRKSEEFKNARYSEMV